MDYILKNTNFSTVQYVILDVGIPTPAHITEAVLLAIQNVLCLGPDRLSAVGLALINSVFQQVISISSTNSQFHKIYHAIKVVTDSGKCRARLTTDEFKDMVHIGLKTAIEDFQSFPNKLAPHDCCPSELQIMILSMKNMKEVQLYVQQLLTVLPSNKLRKVQLVELVEDYLYKESPKNESRVSVLVERIKVPGSSTHLEELMKQWLVRPSCQFEDVRIALQGDCVVLCDIQECLIRPATGTILNSKTSIKQDFSNSEEVMSATLYLEVTQRLASDGLCQTQMSEDPVILNPSESYQQTWHEKQINQQYYLQLVRSLLDAEEYLIAKCEINGQLLKYFVLIPGEGMLLMRSLVTAEESMPSRKNPTTPMMTPEIPAKMKLTETLFSLPLLEAYNPADFPTGLYKHLRQSLLHQVNQGSAGSTSTFKKKEPLCRDPSSQTVVVGIEIKKTTKRKRTRDKQVKKHLIQELPKLSDSDQQAITDYFSKQQKNKTNSLKWF